MIVEVNIIELQLIDIGVNKTKYLIYLLISLE